MEPMIQREQVTGTKEKTHSRKETPCLESGVRQFGLSFSLLSLSFSNLFRLSEHEFTHRMMVLKRLVEQQVASSEG